MIAVLMSPARFMRRRKTRFSSSRGARLVMVSLQRNLPLTMRSKALRAAFGRVVEAGAEGDVVVVQAIGVEFDFGSGGASAEEVDGAAFADHVDGPLPGERGGDGFDGDIDAATLRSEGADVSHGIGIGGRSE